MLALALALACFVSDTPRSEAIPKRDFQLEQQQRHATMLRRLMRRGDPEAVRYVVAQLDRGLPPPILGVFLNTAREAPHPAYTDHLRRLTRHRTRHLRARAIVALAVHGHESEATLAALDDGDIDIRFLGLEMVQRYTTPALEEAAIALLHRDEELARLADERAEAESGDDTDQE
jgi:hypothetical protein